mmetsp:Transcript_20632/g.57693  ORF Transcript_20632/g.57693 Transcript_20632/m.57693 type:complete len:143 (+) Transcript_20632:530-958(+)
MCKAGRRSNVKTPWSPLEACAEWSLNASSIALALPSAVVVVIVVLTVVVLGAGVGIEDTDEGGNEDAASAPPAATAKELTDAESPAGVMDCQVRFAITFNFPFDAGAVVAVLVVDVEVDVEGTVEASTVVDVDCLPMQAICL